MDLSKVLIIVGCLLVVAAIITIYKVILNPSLKYHSLPYKIKAAIVFWVGRLHYVGLPGLFSWVREYPGLKGCDIRDADTACQPGDIGLHREKLVASNWGIPGAFKHAWIMVENNQCVEAMQEGVLKRDRIDPLRTDFACILRPNGVTKEDINEAMERANSIVGCEYDANFNFDFGGEGEKAFAMNIRSGDFHTAFSCTETVGYSWYHKRDLLRLFRTTYAGREAIIADDYLKMNLEIVYLSPNVTVEWAKKVGLHEEGRVKIAEYWQKRAKSNR